MDTPSESSTSQSTSSSTTDARVGADNGAVVIQAGGQQNISFSPDVAKAVGQVVNSITDFSNGVVGNASGIVNNTVARQEQTVNDVLNFGNNTVKDAFDAASASNANSISLVKSVLDFGKSALAAAPSTSPAASTAIVQGASTSDIIGAIKGPLMILVFGAVGFFLFKSFRK